MLKEEDLIVYSEKIYLCNEGHKIYLVSYNKEKYLYKKFDNLDQLTYRRIQSLENLKGNGCNFPRKIVFKDNKPVGYIMNYLKGYQELDSVNNYLTINDKIGILRRAKYNII